MYTAEVRPALAELSPMLRRAVALDADVLVRFRLGNERLSGFVRLPFDVLVGRSVAHAADASTGDSTARAADVLRWLDSAGTDSAGTDSAGTDSAGTDSAGTGFAVNLGSLISGNGVPQPMDAWWRTGLPPAGGWRRLDTVPDDIVRGLVRRGALAIKELAATQSLPSGQAGPQAGAALLDTAVLTVDDPPGHAAVSLRTLSALTRMGFAPRGGTVYLDLAGRWLRAVAGYGTVYQERAGSVLSLH